MLEDHTCDKGGDLETRVGFDRVKSLRFQRRSQIESDSKES